MFRDLAVIQLQDFLNTDTLATKQITGGREEGQKQVIALLVYI